MVANNMNDIQYNSDLKFWIYIVVHVFKNLFFCVHLSFPVMMQIKYDLCKHDISKSFKMGFSRKNIKL